MAQKRMLYWLAGCGIVVTLLLLGGMTIGLPVTAGFTPTPTETPTPTPTPTETPTPIPPPPTPPAPLPPPETPTSTPAPLLPEVGGRLEVPAWPLLVLGIIALLAGWIGMRDTKREV